MQTQALPQTKPASRYIRAAYSFVSEQWLPINPEVVSKIQRSLSQGKYSDDVVALIGDIKRDAALYTFCVKRLVELIQEALPDDTISVTPTELLESAGVDYLESIIIEARGFQSRFSAATPKQLALLKNVMISATASQSLAEHQSISGELAYATALFRQLGMTLIVWNYPHIYDRVTDLKEDGESIDLTLSKMLGFSPGLLGYSIAKEWGLCPELRIALGDKSAQAGVSEETVARAQALEKICLVGEALARANDPQSYPTAQADWKMAKIEILKHLGPDGFQLLTERVRENIRLYEIAFPTDFASAHTLTPKGETASAQSTIGFVNNLYAKYCNPSVQEVLKEIYSRLDGKTVSRENVETLVRDCFPLAGFSRGCVYILEPETFTLTPRLAIGVTSLSDYKAVRYTSSDESDPVIAAYRNGATPVTDNPYGSPERFIAGVLGTSQRAGVLVLELSEEARRAEEPNPMATFKALRQALADCLNLQ